MDVCSRGVNLELIQGPLEFSSFWLLPIGLKNVPIHLINGPFEVWPRTVLLLEELVSFAVFLCRGLCLSVRSLVCQLARCCRLVWCVFGHVRREVCFCCGTQAEKKTRKR